ncbi:E3 ubiquitin-protein ligase DZIP3 [Exaiptasia diaphana]|nr:E3 ubiquitin-protein ligase DZIP3 [Exaiptasia diaphana]
MSGPLWTTETKEKNNYTKLCRLLFDGGSTAVRSEFDKKCPPLSLATVLTKEHPNLLKLKKPIGRVLNNYQWSKLYPAALADSATGWDVLPPSTDNSLEANLVRIKYYRNEVIAHNSSAEVDDVDFKKYWKEISAALVSLGLQQYDIDVLKTSPSGPDNYNQLLKEWQQSDEDIQSQLKQIGEDTSESRLDVKKIKLDVSDTKEISKNIKADIAEIKQRLPYCSQPEIDKLAQRDFTSTVSKLCQSYHPKTREWILDEIKSHVETHRDNTIVLQAGPGMGKSVVAGKLCQFYKEQGNLGACHFFHHDNSLHSNPMLMLQSVARQLCDSLPGYQAAVEKQLKAEKEISNLNCKELFTLLFQEPCSKLRSEHNVVIVIDALDESHNSYKREFFGVLNNLSDLPSYLRFILTTRPPPSISAIHIGTTREIKPDDGQNKNDLHMFLSDKLREHGYLLSDQIGQINHLVDVTKGLFLVAFFVIDFLKDANCASLSEAIEHFPKGKGITSVYENYFSRLKEAMIPHIKSEESFFEMLDAVVAAKYPIQKDIFYEIVGLVDEPRVPNRERKEAIHLLHQLFPVENDHVSAFHKTVIDWLTTGDHDFRVKGDGSGVIANACYEILHSIKEGSKNIEEPLYLTEREKHAFTFGGLYMDSQSLSEDKRIETQTSCLLFCFRFISYCLDFHGQTVSFNYSLLSSEIVYIDKKDVYEIIGGYIDIKRYHKQHCQFYHPITLSNFLETVLQSLHLQSITSMIQLNPKPLDMLKEYGFPYQERQIVMSLPDRESSVLPCDKGFFLLKNSHLGKETLVQKYQLDGTLLLEKTFDGNKTMCMSPDNQFIIAFPMLAMGDIEIIDATNLQLLTRYKAPNVIRTYHVYGSQPWYIVIRCLNNKIYVMDGETGKEVHQPVDIDQCDEVEAVSCQGHMVIGKTCLLFPVRDDMHRLFTNEDGTIFEEMIWGNKGSHGTPAQCRKLFLCHFNESHEFIKIPIYPRVCLPQCQCKANLFTSQDHFQYETIKFSDDGQLLAFVYKSVFTVLDTTDYSEVASIQHYILDLYHRLVIHDILFLTKDFIVLNDSDTIYCISLETKDVERMFTIYHKDSNRPPLQLYIVPGFVGGEKVFLSITKNLDVRKLLSPNEALFRMFNREHRTDVKDDSICYIYKHSIYDLQLEK